MEPSMRHVLEQIPSGVSRESAPWTLALLPSCLLLVPLMFTKCLLCADAAPGHKMSSSPSVRQETELLPPRVGISRKLGGSRDRLQARHSDRELDISAVTLPGENACPQLMSGCQELSSGAKGGFHLHKTPARNQNPGRTRQHKQPGQGPPLLPFIPPLEEPGK